MKIKDIFISIALCASASLGACSGGDEPQVAEQPREYVYSLDLTLNGEGGSRAEKLEVEGAYLYFALRPKFTSTAYLPGYAVYTDGAWSLHTNAVLHSDGLATIVYAGESVKSTSFASVSLNSEAPIYVSENVEYVRTGASSVQIVATLKPQGTRMRFVVPQTTTWDVLNLACPSSINLGVAGGVSWNERSSLYLYSTGLLAQKYFTVQPVDSVNMGFYRKCNFANERFFKLKNSSANTAYALWCGSGSKLENLFEQGTTATLNVADNAYVQDVKTYTNTGFTISSFSTYETYRQIDYWTSTTGYTVTFQYRINDYVEGNSILDVKCLNVDTYYELAGDGVDVDNEWHTVTLSFFNPSVTTYYLRFYHMNVKFEVGTVSWSSF